MRLGNQWVTAGAPGQPRDHDLLYWSVLRFDGDGQIQQLVREDTVSLSLE
jgi:hypothetical protein